MRLVKVHGLGNDFLIADLRAGTHGEASPLDPEVARRLCDRRFGVGADGVLAIELPGDGRAVARMRIRNADGSEPEMCGNGIRCVAKYLHDRALAHDVLPIETGAGVLDCAIVRGSDGRAAAVAVEMGRPEVVWREEPIALLDRTFAVTHVTIGNPHAIAFVQDPDLRAVAARYGPALERHARFPRRTNAEFARVADGRIELVVWERGCGITLACGTGASATAAAAVALGRLPGGGEIEVGLPGGALFVRVAPDLSGVRMRGPAVEVFEAEVPLGAVAG